MPIHRNQPDLDETINVTQAHGSLDSESSAVAREKRLLDTGREPVSLWVFIVCGVALLIAGSIFGQAGRLLDYKQTFREGYIRATPPGADESGPVPVEALRAYMAKGERIYSSKCNGCHGSDAKGDGSNYPSLVGSEFVLDHPEGLAMIILHGLQGPTSTGKSYGAGVMPSQAAGMSAVDLASIMTYVRNNFGNDTGTIVTVEMAQAAMDLGASRDQPGQNVTAEEIRSQHQGELPGEPLDPTTLVDGITLEPAPAE